MDYTKSARARSESFMFELKDVSVCLVLLASLFCFSQTQVQPTSTQAIQTGEPHVIQGCGTSGCYQSTSICVSVPVGATPISITRYYDSFIGWGQFVDPQKT